NGTAIGRKYFLNSIIARIGNKNIPGGVNSNTFRAAETGTDGHRGTIAGYDLFYKVVGVIGYINAGLAFFSVTRGCKCQGIVAICLRDKFTGNIVIALAPNYCNAILFYFPSGYCLAAPVL